MKHLSKLLVVALLAVGLNNVQAQDENNPWQVSFGVNAIDVYPTDDVSSFGNEFFNATTTGTFFHLFPTFLYPNTLVTDFLLELEVLLNRIDKLGDVSVDDFLTTLLTVLLNMPF